MINHNFQYWVSEYYLAFAGVFMMFELYVICYPRIVFNAHCYIIEKNAARQSKLIDHLGKIIRAVEPSRPWYFNGYMFVIDLYVFYTAALFFSSSLRLYGVLLLSLSITSAIIQRSNDQKRDKLLPDKYYQRITAVSFIDAILSLIILSFVIRTILLY